MVGCSCGASASHTCKVVSVEPQTTADKLLCSGLYLPLTAVLGGLLFVRPEGYAEAQRDVIRLTADVELLREQQGFITCEPLDPTEGGPIEPLPLHCSLLVIPAQV